MSDDWKPTPGKPAMTQGGYIVTDLERTGDSSYGLIRSPKLGRTWYESGQSPMGQAFNLIKPPADILARHGIDANGKPVK